MKKLFILFLLPVVLCLPITVFAQSASITLTLSDNSTKEAVSGETVLFYYFDEIEENELTKEDVRRYEQKVLSGEATGVPVVSDNNGFVCLKDCKEGIYFVKSEKEIFEAFCVTVPYKGKYNVDASPKIELYKETPSSPSSPNNKINEKLPQTGMLQWPIPLLAFGGVIVFAIGYIINETSKRKEK